MKEITTEEIIQFLNRDKLSLLYFYTPMCGTCEVAGKMLTVAEQLFPQISMVKANLNFSPSIAAHLQIESVPCLIIIKNSTVKEKIYAFQSVSFLYDKIKLYL
jgi:thioredoxin 1